jgi:adenine-specific DNA-methyltransferase
LLSFVSDNLVWYAKDIGKVKYRQLWFSKLESKTFQGQDIWADYADGRRERLGKNWDFADLPSGAKVFRHTSLKSAGASETGTVPFEFGGREFHPGQGQHWKTTIDGLRRVAVANRLLPFANTLEFVSYLNDFPFSPFTNIWTDTVSSGFSEARIYVVQTNLEVIKRCLLMTTDPGDHVFDPTCGSGSTAVVAEQWGRRWITCDTSRVAITLAKQRLMTALYDYYELAHPEEGVGSGFAYKSVPHVNLKSIANNPEIRNGMTREQIDAAIAKYAEQETLYDQPLPDKNKARVSGPFTVEAVPDSTAPIGDWKEAWEAAKERAKVACRFHDLRHTACTRTLESGTPLSVVATLMGWSPSTTVRMSRRHGHIGQAAQREAVKALEGESAKIEAKPPQNPPQKSEGAKLLLSM